MIVRAAIQALMATFRKGGREKQGYAGMIQAEELGKPISDQPVGLACSAKAARLMQKAIQTWQNQASEHLEAYMESLEPEMQKADGAENSAKQRMVLRWAVAALSPPRCHLSDGCEGKMPVSNTSNDQSTPVVCRDREDLAGWRLAPMRCLQSLLQIFQELAAKA
ncbi:unnamed protein product [Effrenium voratum]|nr:unnamed protein product [Effrenium voratum]